MRRALLALLAAAACLACAAPGDAPAPEATLGSVPAWEQPAPAAADRPVVDASKLTRTTLDNGLEVLVLQDHRLPRLAYGVTVRRGAGDEDPGRAGVAGFTAELMERGAGERTALELAAVVDDLGASLSVGADWDSMDASVSGLSRDGETLFAVLSDVVLRPRFDADEALRVRDERVAGLTRALEDPETLVRWHLYRALYAGHRYGLAAEGTAGSVAGFDADDARETHARAFTPANAVFWAVGDLEPEALLAEVRATYGGWQGGDVPAPGTPPPAVVPEARRIVIVDRPDLGQAQIAVGHEGIARADERRMIVQLMNTVLGAGGFSSRLMSTVRADEGLTYGIGSSFGQRRSPGPFAVRTFTRVPEVGRVVELVLGELEGMQTDSPGTEELDKAKGLRTGSFGLALETSEAVLAALVSFDVYGLPEDSLDTYRRRVRAVTPEEVALVAGELLHPARAAIVVVGPADAIRPQLEPFGPVDVVTP